MITESPDPEDAVVVGDTVADVYVGDDDHEVARIAAGDLCEDVERVTDRRPDLVASAEKLGSVAVVVGTAGADPVVDDCLAAASADAEAFREQSESFLIETLADPPLSAESAVLIAGSDRRGTAYAAYELAESAGVSPWYWWADVEPASREMVAVEAGTYEFGPPSVTYRGVFLNDEDFGLRPWAHETHAPEDSDRSGIGPTTYERLFELLLRLKANTIWPAMHPDTKAFYRYPEHAELADRYAIVVGTSHCEPMHRNNVDEWEDPHEEWDYGENAERIREYWRERVADVADYENVFTVGMRGIHDSGMPGGDTREETVELLQGVLDDQRSILDETHDRPPEEVPQVFCPYKEVLDLYRGGLDVPDDVCVMWPDDSHGYIRELPTEGERDRSGGGGVYYHLSYWGRPHDYLWLSSVPPGLIGHEMAKAYAAGARDYWVANVGDVKPTEKETEYFLDLAWDLEGTRSGSVRSWLESWATREFGADHADAIAGILSGYYRLAQSRKPEHMGWSTVYPDTPPGEPGYSTARAGDEARRRVDAFADLVERAEGVREALPEADRAAFEELVGYQVRSAAAMTEKYLAAARSRRYAGQGRASADDHADRALAAHDRIAEVTRSFNEDLRGGKWDGMMDHSPRDLPAFDEPSTAAVTPQEGPALGVAVEGRERPVREDEVGGPTLPAFHPAVDRERFVDVYARGTDAVEWSLAETPAWVTVAPSEGAVDPADGAGGSDDATGSGGPTGSDRRLTVTVDWDAVPGSAASRADESGGPVTASGDLVIEGAGTRRTVGVAAVVPGTAPPGEFAEVDGALAMEAEGYTGAVDGSRAAWERCDAPGRVTDETMRVAPHVFEGYADDSGDAPTLEFDLAVETGGSATVAVHCLPTQALNDDRDLRYGVELGDESRQVVSVDPEGGEHDPEWQRNVLRGAAIGRTTHRIEPGERTLRLAALDPGLIVDRIVVYTDGEERTYLGPRSTATDDR